MPGCDKPTAPPSSASPTPAAPSQPRPDARPARLVVLSPALAVILHDLHADPLIVGRHGFDMVLDKSIPVCGDQAGIDYEALIRANPTHILIEWGRRDLPSRLTTLAAKHRWHVESFEILTLDQVRDAARRLYEHFITTPALDSAAPPPPWPQSDLALAMDRAWSKRTTPAGLTLDAAGRVILLETVNPAHALGPGSFHYQVLQAIGARPIPDTGSPYIELDAEDMLHLAPDAILIIEPRSPGAPPRPAPLTWNELQHKLGPLARLDIPAVRNRRVAVIDDPLALTPSTAMIALADQIAAHLADWCDPPAPAKPAAPAPR